MSRRRGLRQWMLLAMLGASFAARPARADEKQRCVAASEKGQQLRNAGKLSEARDQLAICGRPECPKLVQQDCTQWMSEVLAVLPSIVPGAKDHRGRDLAEVKVSLDGQLLADTLDGRPFVVDPGVHVLRFEANGAPPVEEQLVVRQGERNRIVTVTFAGPDEAKDPPPGGSGAIAAPSAPIAAYVSGGIGVLALGAALYVGLDANADARELRGTCAPHCAQSQVDDVQNRYVIAGVTAALGGAALVAGVVLFLTRHSGSRSAAARLLPILVPGIAARGAATGVALRF